MVRGLLSRRFFFFKQKTAYELMPSLVGSEMCIRDSNFASIVAAIEEGRAVYANIKKFITYIFNSNIPEAVPFVLFILIGIPTPLEYHADPGGGPGDRHLAGTGPGGRAAGAGHHEPPAPFPEGPPY